MLCTNGSNFVFAALSQRHSAGRAGATVRFMFTQVPFGDRKMLEMQLRSLGGELSSAATCTHLVCGALVRTENLLEAISTCEFVWGVGFFCCKTLK
jgi:hypothetical protein